MSESAPPKENRDASPAQVEELKRALEAELDRQLGPSQGGCWPLLIALCGLALGVALLLG